MVELNFGIFYPDLNVYGGAEFVTVIMANALVKNGHDVTLFCSKPVKQTEIENFFSTRIKSPTKIIVKTTKVVPRGLLDSWQVIFRTYDFKRQVDVWIDNYSNRVFPWTNICYIHFPFFNHTRFRPHFPYLKNNTRSMTTFVPDLLLEKSLPLKNQFLIANSQYTANEIRCFLNRPSTVLYPPVPSGIFKEAIREDRENLVVTISRFAEGKGLKKIVDIAAATSAQVKFAVIGRIHNQNVFSKLQTLLRKRGLGQKVTLYPDPSRTQLNIMLKKAKVYLHLTEAEHFGISIVEGMAAGCTPIVHNSGGTREFVPKQYRYNNNIEAADKVSIAVENWSLLEAKQIRKSAENFREEKFMARFTEVANGYLEEKFGA